MIFILIDEILKKVMVKHFGFLKQLYHDSIFVAMKLNKILIYLLEMCCFKCVNLTSN